MNLPPNLPAKNCFRTTKRELAAVQPWRQDVPADRIEAAKQRICQRQADIVARIQQNMRERIAGRRAQQERVQRQTNKSNRMHAWYR